MGNQTQYAVGVAAFFVFFTMVVVSGGLSGFVDQSELDKHNLTQSDLEIDPSQPAIVNEEIDLDSFEKSENIEIVKFQKKDPDYGEFDTGLRWDGTGNNGTVIYDLGNEPGIKWTMTQCDYIFGFFLTSDIQREFLDINNNTVGSNSFPVNACGEEVYIFDDSNLVNSLGGDVQAVEFTLEDNNSYIYQLQSQNRQELNAVQSTLTQTTSVFESVTSWFVLIVGLPGALTWLGIFLGIVGLIIFIEWLTF